AAQGASNNCVLPWGPCFIHRPTLCLNDYVEACRVILKSAHLQTSFILGMALLIRSGAL
ncbi:hypothetical protein HAX54_043895, partial [Datura stramonium]|nr:hypothetical protein [Datura stramonium]